jgi:metal-responsive CopG/Arc/MetJ family transcriptional regulator
MPKLVRVTVRMPAELIERIDAHVAGEPASLVAMVASSGRKSGRVILQLPKETIKLIDDFRAAHGVKSRGAAIVRLVEAGLRDKLS